MLKYLTLATKLKSHDDKYRTFVILAFDVPSFREQGIPVAASRNSTVLSLADAETAEAEAHVGCMISLAQRQSGRSESVQTPMTTDDGQTAAQQALRLQYGDALHAETGFNRFSVLS
jgi:hypothetical protein